MTHDELLAKIDVELATNYADECGNFPIGLKALRAVVELHKPRKYSSSLIYVNKKLQTTDSAQCGVCRLYYPCLTVQAIEKELQ